MTWQKGDGDGDGVAKKDRRSLENCAFARTWRALLKATYKEYQKLLLCVYGPKFQFESSHRKACVQALLDASSAVHSKKDHKAFKAAVNDELTSDGVPR